jgi:hypothetical protein
MHIAFVEMVDAEMKVPPRASQPVDELVIRTD